MTKQCQMCDEDFKTRAKKRKFCSHPCYANSRRGIKSSAYKNGSSNPNWRGGKRIDGDGYVLIHSPYHPFCDADGYVREHRLVIEKKTKCFIRKDQVVHHLNGNRSDNRLENLQLLSKKGHDRISALERRKNGFRIEDFSPTVKKSKEIK